MSRILIYSHDTYGLGNVRRMSAIATELSQRIDGASVLMLSGSTMVQGFRLAPNLDYVKLPSLTRTTADRYRSKSLRMELDELIDLRANIALGTVADFRPDVMIVDKRPYGIANELEAAILYAKTQLPDVRLILVLRDILDAPSATRGVWRREGYSEAIERYFDRVLVLGTPSLFDVRTEYSFSPTVRSRVRFCGYLRRPEAISDRAGIRRRLGVSPGARLVLVTPGGGEDGERLVQTYVEALPMLHARPDVASVIVTGPEMSAAARQSIAAGVSAVDRATLLEFTDDMLSVMAAADAIVCMGGYNTLCEVASLGKPAVVVPRNKPVMEQWIRAERFARAGLVSMLDPARLDATSLSQSVMAQLAAGPERSSNALPLTALPRVARQVEAVLRHRQKAAAAVPILSRRIGVA